MTAWVLRAGIEQQKHIRYRLPRSATADGADAPRFVFDEGDLLIEAADQDPLGVLGPLGNPELPGLGELPLDQAV